eukprot:Plantae.Rhodophyta-Hildenbrandia_rubra.ctg11277.p1 GENE.Plantae.Rhodophyta-Hildenbrandia_rubra.ctg11277~~Plantae.Rhodophyta-Hildenbrandia_rubra.ctg11277.p1  ORF type:complete len:560 (-),score=75.50 Plantae.Rhodophyta-Hildenbrandia_rubra.ctg11277:1702-3321(-)
MPAFLAPTPLTLNRFYNARCKLKTKRLCMVSSEAEVKRKCVIVGGGWAGLAAAWHLTKIGRYDVTLVEAGKAIGGLVAGYEKGGKPLEIGIHGSWRPYKNIFHLVEDELGLRPFTTWTKSDSFSPRGKETSAPIFGELPRLPSPFGTLAYTQFHRVGLRDRLTALPLISTLVDFDPMSRDDWRRYDKMTARELLRTMGVSKELYKLIESMLLVGTFCPAEQTSAAACLAFLYFFILSRQDSFDVVWPRGTSGEMIFRPLAERIEQQGGKILTERRVTDYGMDENGLVNSVICGDETIPADTVISCVGVSGMQGILRTSRALASFPEFRAVNKLFAIDVVAVRLYFDRRVKMDKPSNAFFGFDATTGWTAFDLNEIHDRYRDEQNSVIECDFYGAQQFVPMSDDEVVNTVKKYLGQTYKAFSSAVVVDSTVLRVPRGVTHFSPGSHQHMLEGKSPIRNFFNAGDWIWTSHGSFSQERALVSGLEAANNAIDFLDGPSGKSLHADIIPVPADEAHIAFGRRIAKQIRDVREAVAPDFGGWL